MPKRKKDAAPPPFKMRDGLFQRLMGTSGVPYSILDKKPRYNLVGMAHTIGVPLYQLQPLVTTILLAILPEIFDEFGGEDEDAKELCNRCVSLLSPS